MLRIRIESTRMRRNRIQSTRMPRIRMQRTHPHKSMCIPTQRIYIMHMYMHNSCKYVAFLWDALTPAQCTCSRNVLPPTQRIRTDATHSHQNNALAPKQRTRTEATHSHATYSRHASLIFPSTQATHPHATQCNRIVRLTMRGIPMTKMDDNFTKISANKLILPRSVTIFTKIRENFTKTN